MTVIILKRGKRAMVSSRRMALYSKYSLEQLLSMNNKIMKEKRRSTDQSIHLYDKKTCSLLDDIGWAITWKMKDTIKSD